MARRINTRFIVYLLLVILVAGGAILSAQLLKRQHPDEFISAGDQAMIHHQWSEAVSDYAKAAKLSPRDATIELKLGVALHNAINNDAENVGRERAAYEMALEIDPTNLPALKALVKWCQDLTMKPTPDLYNKQPDLPTNIVRQQLDLYQAMIGYARKASALDPSNKELAALPDISLVQESLLGLQPAQEDVNKALDNLSKLMDSDPANAEIPYNIAQARIQAAQEISRQAPASHQPPEATALYDKAREIFEKIFSGKDGGPQEDNAEMHCHFAQILESVANLDRSNPANYKTYIDQAQKQIDRGRALAKDTKDKESQYLQINFYACELALHRGHRDEAIQIIRGLPRDKPQVLLVESQLLSNSPDTRDEAIAILVGAQKAFPNESTRMDFLHFQIIKQLTGLRLDEYATSQSAPEKKRLLDLIQPDINSMQQQRGATTDLREIQRLQARLLFIQNKYTEVIPMLSALVANDPVAASDLNIEGMLADAYERVGQIGKAIDYLTQIVNQYPTQTQFRKKLIEVLLKQSPVLAQQQIDVLEKLAPHDPSVLLYRVTLLSDDPIKNKDEIQKDFDLLPEATPADLINKAQRAIVLRDWDNASRLLSLYLAKVPTDLGNQLVLAQIYMRNHQNDKALEIAQAALKDHPGNPQIQLLIAAAQGKDPEQFEVSRKAIIGQIADPVERAVGLAAMADEEGNLKDVETNLKIAEKLAPENPQIWERLFHFYLKTNRLDDAAIYCDKLAKINYDLAGGLLYRFHLARARGDNGTALQLAQQLTKDYPEFSPSWMSLGEALQALGQYDQATAQYAVAIEKQGNNLQAIQGMIQCNYALQKPNDALHWINVGLSKFPDDQTLHEMMLEYQVKYASAESAVAAVVKERDHAPDNPRIWALLGNTYLRAAQSLEASNHHDDSGKMLTQASTTLHQALVKWPDEEGIYLELAELDVSTGQNHDAEVLFKQWAARDAWKNHVEPYLALSEFYEKIGQPDAAESEMKTALAKSDYRVDMQIKMAEMLAAHHKSDEALKQLYATNADDLTVQREVVKILATTGRVDQAMSTLKGILDKNPSNRGDLLTMGAQILLNNQRYDEAIDQANQALTLNDHNQVALYDRAMSRMFKPQPDFQSALNDLNTLYQMAPYNPDVRIARAKVYIHLSRLDDAVAELEAGLKLTPGNKDIRMNLANLYMSGAHVRFNDAMHLFTEVENTPPFSTDPDIFYSEALLLADHNDVTGAIAKSRKAHELSPKNIAFLREYLAMLLRGKSYQEVLDQTNSMADTDKGNWWLMTFRGTARNGLKDLTGGLADLNQALADTQKRNDLATTNEVVQAIARQNGVDQAIASITPYAKDQLSAKLALVILMHDKGDDAAAVTILGPVLAAVDKLNTPDKFTAYIMAASVYSTLKQPLVDQSVDAFQKALKIHPDDIQALNQLACVLMDNASPPRIPEALQYAQKAVDSMHRSNRMNFNVLDTLGWAQVLGGSLDEGILNLREAIDGAPVPEFYLHLGEGYLKQNDAINALKQGQLGLKMLNSIATAQDPVAIALRSKLQGLIARCQERIAQLKPQTQPQ